MVEKMVEDRSFLVSKGYQRTSEPKNNWPSKRQLENNGVEEVGGKKSAKQPDPRKGVGSTVMLFGVRISPPDQSGDQHRVGANSQSNSFTQINGDDKGRVRKLATQPNACEAVHSTPVMREEYGNHYQVGNNGAFKSLIRGLGKQLVGTDGEEELLVTKFTDSTLVPGDALMSQEDQSGYNSHAGDNVGNSDAGSLISAIGRDISVSCLIRCSRSDYGSIASLNQSFRSLIRTGELYTMRRLNGVVEHWVYISCNLLDWDAFDPNRRHWMQLPKMPSNECFFFGDKESLAVGTELLVFGKELMVSIIYRYSLLTNTWSTGMKMNTARCLFGSASLGEIAIVAGGCGSQGTILSSAELYNSETRMWRTLPNMHKKRKMCSGVFMDGKFYVIGGFGGPDSEPLTSGEEYNLATGTWTEIPNMAPMRSSAASNDAPPLVAVVDNELYAADHASMEVRKYDKGLRVWFTVGRLPERVASMNGWGLAFRACGNRLICIGGPRTLGGGSIEVNSWTPSEGPPDWYLLGRKQSASFVYNCAVMGC